MSAPVLTEISIAASAGGKVQIIKYDLSSDYFVSESRKWSVPEDWTEEDVQEFTEARRDELRERIEKQAQIEFDERFEQSYLNQG